MKYFSLLQNCLVMFILVGVVWSLESPPNSKRNTLPRIPVHRVRKGHEREWLKTHQDSSDPCVSRVSQFVKNTGKTIVPLENLSDLLYLMPVYAGTPLQGTCLQGDTGSSDLVIIANGVDTFGNGFSMSDSSTWKGSHSMYKLRYGDGSVWLNAEKGSDVVQLGNLSASGVTFGVATSTSSDWNGRPFDGIMGMAHPAIASIDTSSTAFESLASANKVPKVFSFFLSRLDRPKEVSGSVLILGGYDMSYAVPNATLWMLRLSRQQFDSGAAFGFWQTDLWHVILHKSGGKTEDLAPPDSSARPSTAVFDTGTSLLGMPDDAYKALEGGVKSAAGSGNCIIPGPGAYLQCNATAMNWAKAPNLTFVMAVTNLGYDKHGKPVLVDFPLNAKQYMCCSPDCGNYYGDNTCSLMASSTGQWILGDTFLSTYMSVFSYEKPLVGLATTDPGAIPSKSSYEIPIFNIFTSVEFWVTLIVVLLLCGCCCGLAYWQFRSRPNDDYGELAEPIPDEIDSGIDWENGGVAYVTLDPQTQQQQYS